MKFRTLLLATAVSALAMSAQDGFRFLRTYKAGEVDRYSVKVTASMSIGDIETRMVLSQEIVKVYENGDADQKTSIASMRNLFNGTELPTQPGTAERSFLQRVTPSGAVVAKAGPSSGLNGMNELFTTGSRLSGKTFQIGQVVNINDVDPKDARNKVIGTAKLESVTDGVAKVVAQLEIWTSERKTPMKAKTTSWLEVATSRPIKIEGKANGLIAGQGLDITEAQFTMERIQQPSASEITP